MCLVHSTLRGYYDIIHATLPKKTPHAISIGSSYFSLSLKHNTIQIKIVFVKRYAWVRVLMRLFQLLNIFPIGFIARFLKPCAPIAIANTAAQNRAIHCSNGITSQCLTAIATNAQIPTVANSRMFRL